MIYEWSKARSFSVPPQVVGEVVESIEREWGYVEPEVLVDVARTPSSPVHKLFTWDDERAATQWRTHEARRVINSLVVTVTVGDREVQSPAFVSVGHTKATQSLGGGYRSVMVVASDGDFAEEALHEVLAKLTALRMRYDAIDALSGVWREVDRLAEDVA